MTETLQSVSAALAVRLTMLFWQGGQHDQTRAGRFHGFWVPAAIVVLGAAAVYAYCSYRGGTVIWGWSWRGPTAYCRT